ncbi:MAG TPA: glycosyltransferase family 39 protein [Polyangiaceae bacterium]|jgi:dolichyl-phosphate-mannose--protein O-mannosyl transferase|nr:glycosyltransferase family 39 protein [Polyangiaceae bacterium]
MNGQALLAWARSVWKERGPGTLHPWTGYLLALMIVAGVVLRIQNVGYPLTYGFDEEQMVTAARQFLMGVPDTGECCHPPLSKLLISASILIFGDNPLGWRFSALCLGIQNLVLVFLIGRALFDDRKAGWLAAAFMATDGFNIAFSRDAFPEPIMTTFVLWSILAAVTARGWLGVLGCAVMVGLAGSIKWSGFQVGLPAVVALLLLRRVPWYSLVCFAVVPVVHIALWMVGLKLIGHPNDLMSVLTEMQTRRNRHLAFVHYTNSLESPWYTWFVLYHPFVLKRGHLGELVRLASSVANPVLFYLGDACLLALPVVGTAVAVSARFRARFRAWSDSGFNKALIILGVSWLSMMLLWFSGRISMYWYHYLTPWSFGILLVAGVLARFERQYPKEVLFYVALVAAVFVWFAPVWGEFPITQAAANRRLISPMWR